MNRLAGVMLAGIIVSGCSGGIGDMVGIGSSDLDPGDKIRDEQAAIEIGQRVCSQGAQDNGAYNWHAKREGNNWRVWSGPEYDGHHVMELKVAKSTGKATECFRYAG
jgi:hypothetical protein